MSGSTEEREPRDAEVREGGDPTRPGGTERGGDGVDAGRREEEEAPAWGRFVLAVAPFVLAALVYLAFQAITR